MFTCSSNRSEIVKSINYVVRAISKGYVYVVFKKIWQCWGARFVRVKPDKNGWRKTTFWMVFSILAGQKSPKNLNLDRFMKICGGGLTLSARGPDKPGWEIIVARKPTAVQRTCLPWKNPSFEVENTSSCILNPNNQSKRTTVSLEKGRNVEKNGKSAFPIFWPRGVHVKRQKSPKLWDYLAKMGFFESWTFRCNGK